MSVSEENRHVYDLSQNVTSHLIFNKSNTRCDTIGAGTAYSSGAPEFTPGFSEVCVGHFV